MKVAALLTGEGSCPLSKHTFNILDCTLRDGGYYTNWDFSTPTVDSYIQAMNSLPIDYLEVGYRNNPSRDYLGKFGYTPVSALRQIREICSKKIAVMLNEKSTKPTDLPNLLMPIKGLVDMVRLAVDPKNIDRAIELSKSVKDLGFEIGFNVMYMSMWSEMDGFLPKLRAIDDTADLFCMVDSFGGISPKEVKRILTEVRQYINVPIGFHGHNNLQLGLINTLTAIDNDIDYVDATITGMGRGAGNLEMELLLTYLNKHEGLEVDFNVLGDVITAFAPLKEKYGWGTNLPYMLSGANNIPQKEVMEWVTNRQYSFNSIVRALNNRRVHVKDNAKFPVLSTPHNRHKVLIIGGGSTVVEHLEGIKQFICSQNDMALIFATARYAALFADMDCTKYYCLVGREAKRLTQNIDKNSFQGFCILPPYPRTMGTDVPDFAMTWTYELPSISFADNKYEDSCTTVAIQTALEVAKIGEIYVAGYDGYLGNVLSEKEMSLSNENRELFDSYHRFTGHNLISLTPSLYKNLEVQSLYQYI